jgi:regulatory protein YycI of two-component signal transduction system YycFG
MNWSRAKTVLILSFFVLNVLLGFQLWAGKFVDSYSEAGVRREEASRLLAAKQIKVETEVPEATPKLSGITVKFQHGLPTAEQRALSEPFDRGLLSSAADIRGLLVEDMPEISRYEPDPYAANNDKAVYIMNQLYNQLPMFEVRVELFAKNGMVNSYRRLYASVQQTEAAGGEAQTVLSAYTVLGSLAENYLPAGAVVKDIRLGYHGPIFESETQVLAPYWRVALEGGDLYYVHAINGAVEGPSSLGQNMNNK